MSEKFDSHYLRSFKCHNLNTGTQMKAICIQSLAITIGLKFPFLTDRLHISRKSPAIGLKNGELSFYHQISNLFYMLNVLFHYLFNFGFQFRNRGIPTGNDSGTCFCRVVYRMTDL